MDINQEEKKYPEDYKSIETKLLEDFENYMRIIKFLKQKEKKSGGQIYPEINLPKFVSII